MVQRTGGVLPATCAESSQRAVRSALVPVSVSMGAILSVGRSPRLSPLLPWICRTKCAVSRLQNKGPEAPWAIPAPSPRMSDSLLALAGHPSRQDTAQGRG